MEERLRRAVSNVSPNVFFNIEQKIKKEDNKMGKKVFKLLSSAVAACLVICLGIGGYGYYSNNYKLDSIVDIDVNPSVEILVNKNSRVITAKALNSDAEKVLEGMDLKNVDIKVATNAIIGSIVQNGYMESGDAGVLVTVINDNAEKAEALKEKVAADIEESLKENNVDADIIKQVVVQSKELKALAEENKVSVGKVALARDLAEKKPEIDVNEATKKPIKELVKVVLEDAKLEEAPAGMKIEVHDGKYEIEFAKGNKEFEYDVDSSTGKILDKEIKKDEKGEKNEKAEEVKNEPVREIKITEEEAKDIALKDANISEESASDLEIELDKEKYEVEFTTADGIEYSYEIGAANGKILSKEIDDEKVQKEKPQQKEGIRPEGEPKPEEEPKPKEESKFEINREEAKDIALKDAGVDEVRGVKVELDEDKYEVEFVTKDGIEYSYEIDATSGEILSVETEEFEEDMVKNKENKPEKREKPKKDETVEEIDEEEVEETEESDDDDDEEIEDEDED